MSLVAGRDLAQMRGVLDELANCVLTKIQAPGQHDDWDRPDPTGGAVLWQGRAKAYVGRSLELAVGQRRQGVTDADVEAERTDDTLTILDGRAALGILAGPDQTASLLTIEDQRVTPFVTLTFRASKVRHQMFGLLDYIEVKLRDPATPAE